MTDFLFGRLVPGGSVRGGARLVFERRCGQYVWSGFAGNVIFVHVHNFLYWPRPRRRRDTFLKWNQCTHFMSLNFCFLVLLRVVMGRSVTSDKVSGMVFQFSICSRRWCTSFRLACKDVGTVSTLRFCGQVNLAGICFHEVLVVSDAGFRFLV